MIIGRDWVLHEIGYNILSKGGIPSLNSVPSSTITRHLLCGQPPINLCSHWIRLGIALIAPTMSQTHFWNVSSWMQHIDANISSGSYVLANNNTHNKCCGPATSGMLIAMSHNIKHLSRLIPNNDWCHCLLQPGPHNYCNPLSLHHTYEMSSIANQTPSAIKLLSSHQWKWHALNFVYFLSTIIHAPSSWKWHALNFVYFLSTIIHAPSSVNVGGKEVDCLVVLAWIQCWLWLVINKNLEMQRCHIMLTSSRTD